VSVVPSQPQRQWDTVDREGRLVSLASTRVACVTADRNRRLADRARRALPGQTPELAQRRGGQSDGSLCSPTRPTASIPTTKVTPLHQRSALLRLPLHRRAAMRGGGDRFVKPNGLAFLPDEKAPYNRRHRRTHVKNVPHIRRFAVARMAARSRVARSFDLRSGTLDGFRLDVRGTHLDDAGRWRPCYSPDGLSSARSISRGWSPISASAPSATACSSPDDVALPIFVRPGCVRPKELSAPRPPGLGAAPITIAAITVPSKPILRPPMAA